MKSLLNLLILFILLNLINQCYSKLKTINIKYLESNLLELPILSFYKDRYTVGDNIVPQVECKSSFGGCIDSQPNLIKCKNNDYQNYLKINATELNWYCYSDELTSSSYYIDNSNTHVQCQELYRSSTGIFVVQGSCQLKYQLSRPSYFKYLLIGFLIVVSLILIGCFIYYIRNKRRNYEQIP